jgi:hypothetical protein
MLRSWQSNVQLKYQTNNAATTAMMLWSNWDESPVPFPVTICICLYLSLLSFQLKCSSNIDSIHYLRLTNSFHQVPRDIDTLPVKEANSKYLIISGHFLSIYDWLVAQTTKVIGAFKLFNRKFTILLGSVWIFRATWSNELVSPR